MKQEIVNFYDNYLEKLKPENNRHRWVFNSIDKFIPNGKVLDLGCGTGITSRHLAKGDRDVVAVDGSPKLIDFAEKMNSHFGRVKYVVGDVCEFTWIEPFDSILMVDVLEHIELTRVPELFEVLRNVSHEKTVIYLNIPSENVIRYLKNNRPGLLQIIDNPIDTKHILKWFEEIGFVPAYFQLYWQQYVEYLFVTKESYNETMQGAF